MSETCSGALVPCEEAHNLPLCRRVCHRWYLRGIGQHALLEAHDERLLALDVQELLRWQSIRARLHTQLKRQPTQREWSHAVGFDDVASEPKHEVLLEGRSFAQQLRQLKRAKVRAASFATTAAAVAPVSYTHLTLPTTPYV